MFPGWGIFRLIWSHWWLANENFALFFNFLQKIKPATGRPGVNAMITIFPKTHCYYQFFGIKQHYFKSKLFILEQ
jgi:hypothetical protein